MINLKSKVPKLLVIGDLIIDKYLWGSCERISPEAPVQVVNIVHESTKLGGAGNVIHNLCSLGAKVDVISVIGDCEVSTELINLLQKIKVGTKFLIKENNRITSKKTRIVASHQQMIRYDRECSTEICIKSQDSILKKFKKIINDYDVILLSDYGKGVLTFALTQSLINLANEKGKKLLVDPKGFDYRKYKGAYLLTPNKKEASEATDINIIDDKSLAQAMLYLKKQCDLSISLITLSEDGVAVFDDNLRIHPTVAREIYDVTGAGDTVLASIGFALSLDYDIDKSIKFANLAAGVVIGKIGSATASLDEIIKYESSLNGTSSNKVYNNWNEFSLIIHDLKKQNNKIVFTNGCFDMLHIGHIKYLEKSKSFGDILIVGLNSDNSVKRLKGENRPINLQNERSYILASLEIVDFVIIFEEDTPFDLIKQIKPDVLTKGGDYEDKEVVGQDIAKELKIINFIDGKSSSETIKRIQNL